MVTNMYRSVGCTPDGFGQKKAKQAMADALTAAEDWLEVESPKTDRCGMRRVRRLCESVC